MILYFSGTGNSAYAAKRISAVTGEPLCSINNKIKNNDISEIDPGGKLIFAVPTYGWRIPRTVEEWIIKTAFKGSPSVYFVLTCGGQIGNAEKYIKKLCAQKGFDYKGTAQIKMPENYIALYTAPTKEEAEKIIRNSEPLIIAAAENIRDGLALSGPPVKLMDHLKSGPINTIYYPLYVHADKFWSTDACTGCMKCERECPLNNIKIVNGKPLWGKECTHCMACICKCPVQAIQYGGKSAGKVRYQCPC